MTFIWLHKSIAYALSGIGLFALTLGGELSPVALFVIACGFVGSWFAEPPLIDDPRYQRFWTAIVLGALGVQAVRVAGGVSLFGLAVEFAALMSLSRLFNRRTGAEYQQLTVLAFLDLIAGTVLTTGLSYAAVFIAFVLFTPWMLALTHFRVEIEAHYPRAEKTAGDVRVARVLASRRIVGPAFLGWTVALSVPLFLLTIGMFLAFPRVGFGFASLGDRRGQTVAGFGDDIELGGFGVIRDDTTVVMRITPRSDVAPDTLDRLLRLRGTAFDHYDGRRWTRSAGKRTPVLALGSYYALVRTPRSSDVRVKVVLESLDEPVLFLPQGTVGLEIPAVGNAGRRLARTVTRGPGFDLRYDARDDVGLAYEAVVSPEPFESTVPVGVNDQLARYLQLPDGHAAVIELARKLTVGDSRQGEKVRTLVEYLRDSGEFTYSLRQEDPAGQLPLMAFLFGHRKGHCEYFATALALLLRAVGIPTRNVTGFLGAEYNRYGRYFAVQQGQAHSWVEAMLPPGKWVTLDPTPPARNLAGAARSWSASLRAMMDALRTYWLLDVVGYDLRSQLSGLRKIGSWMKALGSWGRGGTGRSGATSVAAEGAQRTALAVLACLCFLVGAMWVWWRLKLRPQQASELALGQDAARARRLYLALDAALASRGVGRAPATTPQAHAKTLESSGFRGALTVRRVTDTYLAARYGTAQLSDEEASLLAREVEALRSAEDC